MSKRSQYLQVTFKGLKEKKKCVCAERPEDPANEARWKGLVHLQKPSNGLRGKVAL